MGVTELVFANDSLLVEVTPVVVNLPEPAPVTMADLPLTGCGTDMVGMD